MQSAVFNVSGRLYAHHEHIAYNADMSRACRAQISPQGNVLRIRIERSLENVTREKAAHAFSALFADQTGATRQSRAPIC
jgi:hypothetical protein